MSPPKKAPARRATASPAAAVQPARPADGLPLSTYRQPVQERSRETFRRILATAMAILDEHGVEALTTNRVAMDTGISVATLYRFFPNKESIVYAAYEHWTSELSARVEEVIAHWRGDEAARAQGWPAVAGALADALAAFHPTANAEYELLRAMWSHRELLRLDQEHSGRLAGRIASLMTELGSPLPVERLTVLAGFANELFTLATERGGRRAPAEQRAIVEVARQAYLALWAHAMAGTEPASTTATPSPHEPRP